MSWCLTKLGLSQKTHVVGFILIGLEVYGFRPVEYVENAEESAHDVESGFSPYASFEAFESN